jgi:general secretion pathway protein K
LSSFIAADHSSSDTEEDQTDAFLSGQISDLQSRLNISNLVQGGEVHKPTVRAFVRLYSALHLPESELLSLIQNLRLTQEQDTVSTSNGYTSLMPHNVDQLGWLGLSNTSIQVLRPYVVVLPEPTTVNLNTAPALVLFACIGPIDRAGAQRLVAARAQAHFRTMADVTKAAGLEAKALDDGQYSLNSLYFEVSGRLRMGTSIAEERSVVQRDGLQVKVLWRERGALAPATSVQSQPIQ